MADGAARGGPKYRQIADGLRDLIAEGKYAPGDQLPVKRALMADYRAALATVDSALDVLRREGLIETVQGSGTFVRKAPDPEPDTQDAVERRVEAAEMDIMELYAKLGFEQPSHQQNGKKARRGRAS
jgi:DNA-binding GntR family transcriptional regulator